MKQCIQLDDQQKLNHENPFRLALREIPRKFLYVFDTIVTFNFIASFL